MTTKRAPPSGPNGHRLPGSFRVTANPVDRPGVQHEGQADLPGRTRRSVPPGVPGLIGTRRSGAAQRRPGHGPWLTTRRWRLQTGRTWRTQMAQMAGGEAAGVHGDQQKWWPKANDPSMWPIPAPRPAPMPAPRPMPTPDKALSAQQGASGDTMPKPADGQPGTAIGLSIG